MLPTVMVVRPDSRRFMMADAEKKNGVPPIVPPPPKK
jgi:hypothetical protein